MSQGLFWVCSFSLPFVTHTHSCIGFLSWGTDADYCKSCWQSLFTVPVQKPLLFYGVCSFDIMFLIWHSFWRHIDKQLLHVFNALLSPYWKAQLCYWLYYILYILIYWLVSSSILAQQSSNLPKDCHYWSFPAWHRFLNYWALLMFATLPGLLFIRQSGLMKTWRQVRVRYILYT